MKRAWLVVRRDVGAAVRTRSFLLRNLLGPALIPLVLAFMAVPMLLMGPRPDVGATGHVVVVDEAGGLGARVAALLGDAHLKVDEVVVPGPELAELDRLDGAVLDGAIDGYVRVDASSAHDGGWAWHADDPAPAWIEGRIRQALRYAVLEAAWRPEADGRALVERLKAGGEARWVQIGGEEWADREHEGAMLGAMVLTVAMFMLPTLALGGVYREQQAGLLDLLTNTLTPTELVLGKACAALLVALAAVSLWCVIPGASLAIGWWSLPDAAVQAREALSELAPHPYTLVAWIALLGATTFAFVLVAVAAAAPGGSGGGSNPAAWAPVAGYALMFALVPLLDRLDHPLTIALSVVPLLGAPAVFARFAVGLVSGWQVAAAAIGAVGAGVGAAWLLVRLGRGTRALGGWPRSVGELRAAWRA